MVPSDCFSSTMKKDRHVVSGIRPEGTDPRGNTRGKKGKRKSMYVLGEGTAKIRSPSWSHPTDGLIPWWDAEAGTSQAGCGRSLNCSGEAGGTYTEEMDQQNPSTCLHSSRPCYVNVTSTNPYSGLALGRDRFLPIVQIKIGLQEVV